MEIPIEQVSSILEYFHVPSIISYLTIIIYFLNQL